MAAGKFGEPRLSADHADGADQPDLVYFAQSKPLDYYAMYTAHNYQFLAFSTAMQGRKADTIDATRKVRAVVSDDLLMAMPGSDWYLAETYATMVRFGMWDEMLAVPPPRPWADRANRRLSLWTGGGSGCQGKN